MTDRHIDEDIQEPILLIPARVIPERMIPARVMPACSHDTCSRSVQDGITSFQYESLPDRNHIRPTKTSADESNLEDRVNEGFTLRGDSFIGVAAPTAGRAIYRGEIQGIRRKKGFL